MGTPEPGDQFYKGRLAIPYISKCPVKGTTVTTITFRALQESNKKYLKYPGHHDRIYNPGALLLDTDYICICEGEIDCISASQAGIAAIGVPGVNAWAPWMRRAVKGYKTVYILQDNDEAGEQFTKKLAETVRNVKAIPMVDGDVNATLVSKGEEYLREQIGL